jgi:hypothetical protein
MPLDLGHDGGHLRGMPRSARLLEKHWKSRARGAAETSKSLRRLTGAFGSTLYNYVNEADGEAGSERRVEQNPGLIDKNRINAACPRTSEQRIAVHCHQGPGYYEFLLQNSVSTNFLSSVSIRASKPGRLCIGD